MFSKMRWCFAILVVVTLVLAACGTPEPAQTEKLKVAFIYIGPPGDLGWTYEHERGRLVLEEKLGDKVETVP